MKAKGMFCTVKDCGKPTYAKGMCRNHNARMRRNGDLIQRHRGRMARDMGPCQASGCHEPATITKYCTFHYRRFYRTGDPNHEPAKNQAMGMGAEARVATLFHNFSVECRRSEYLGAHDLLVAAKWEIEVKCASMRVVGEKALWLFNIHRHGVLNERCDAYILRFEGIPYQKHAIHALFKSPIGRKTVGFELRRMIRTLAPNVSAFDHFVRTGDLTAALKYIENPIYLLHSEAEDGSN